MFLFVVLCFVFLFVKNGFSFGSVSIFGSGSIFFWCLFLVLGKLVCFWVFGQFFFVFVFCSFVLLFFVCLFVSLSYFACVGPCLVRVLRALGCAAGCGRNIFSCSSSSFCGFCPRLPRYKCTAN